jgi:hypothetical protein
MFHGQGFLMSVHSEGRGKHRVRYRDEDSINRSRTFRRKADAEQFDRQVKKLKVEVREHGYITIPSGFDPDHPLAESMLIGQLDDLLSALHPGYRFTITTHDADGETELPLNGSITWQAQTEVDFRAETADQNRRFSELARRHPEIMGDDGEIDYDNVAALRAAMDAEPDLFGRTS